MKALVTTLVLVGALAGAAVVWQTMRRPEPVSPSRLLRPQMGTITRGVVAIGRVEPRTRVEVKSRANGILLELHVDVNDRVETGQVIAELDKEILQARVAEAEGKLSQALAEVERSRALLRQLELEEGNPQYEFAEKSWKRAAQLYKDEVLSEDDLDLAKERQETALYTLRLLEVKEQVARADVTVAEGRLKEVQAQAELARQELKEADILSPIDGVVLYRYLEEGDAVSSIRVAGGNATVIMTLGDLSELYVDGEVDEVDVGKIIDQQQIRPNLAARVTVDSFQGRTFPGQVTRITPLGLEDSSGIVTFEVRIALENPEKLLLANMTANSLIVLEEKSEVLLLSQGAIVTDAGKRYAFVYDPGTGQTERTEIQVGISDGSQVEVTGGLTPATQVLVP